MTQTWLWFAFIAAIGAMLAVDLSLFQRRSHAVSLREAALWSAVWVLMALAFAGAVWVLQGRARAMLFLTGYILEKSLSVDNLFVFAVIFLHFQIPYEHQARVLHWGILGAIAMRFIFIFAGVSLIQTVHWILYLFGVLLLWTAGKLLIASETPHKPGESSALHLLHRFLPVTESLHGQSFLTRVQGRLSATPLLAALVVVEASDLVFALDSVPAALAVTSDLFLVYTSNIFAVMGLRALYFLLAGSMAKFRHLKTGISLTLGFIGLKLLIHPFWQVPTGWSLAAVGGLLGASIAASLWEERLS